MKRDAGEGGNGEAADRIAIARVAPAMADGLIESFGEKALVVAETQSSSANGESRASWRLIAGIVRERQSVTDAAAPGPMDDRTDDDAGYYAGRHRHALEQAAKSDDPAVRAIHLVLAAHYAALSKPDPC